MEVLQEYGISDIHHKSGKTNIVADALSRRPDLRLNALQTRRSSVVAHFKHRILDARTHNPAYMQVLQAAKNGDSSFVLDDGLVYQVSGGGRRLYVPTPLQQSIISETHDTLLGGHFGVNKTTDKLSRQFYWPHLEHTVRTFIGTCHSCQRNKPSSQRPAGLLQPLEVPSEPWEEVSMDHHTTPEDYYWIRCNRGFCGPTYQDDPRCAHHNHG